MITTGKYHKIKYLSVAKHNTIWLFD